MAVIDRTAGVIIVRIAYDGEARAGKTTNLHALSRSLSRVVYTPPQPGERTLFFDWLEYTGGLFEGMQVRCEVVSVPGQEFLTARRELLVRSADVVVHVVDMSTASAERIDARLRQLSQMCEPDGKHVPCGLLVQANKCDLAHSLSLEELRDLCARQPHTVGVREAVAKDGVGIRETFVFAVRLALDRVRELSRLGEIPERAADAVSGEALLAWLRATEGTVQQRADLEDDGACVEDGSGGERADDFGVPDVDAKGAILQVLAENEVVDEARAALVRDDASTDDTAAGDVHDGAGTIPAPALPDPSVPTGMIWPPMEGRILLEEVTNCDLELTRTASGAWLATVGERWRLHLAPYGTGLHWVRDVDDASLEAELERLRQELKVPEDKRPLPGEKKAKPAKEKADKAA